MCRFALRLLLAVLATLAIRAESALATGPTGEEAALDALNSAAHPFVLSGDGHWRVFVDTNGVMHRMKNADPAVAEEIDLQASSAGARTVAIAASRTALKVAFVTEFVCVGIVEFWNNESPDAKPGTVFPKPRVTWLNLADETYPGQHAKKCPVPPPESGQGDRIQSASIAMSGDGMLIAMGPVPYSVGVDPGEIHIVNWSTGGLVLRVPSAVVLDVRFVDDDSKLLVAQAQLGEGYESESGPSDVLFSVWDLKRRELHSLFHTNPRNTVASLAEHDFLWSFSERTGELYAVHTEVHAEGKGSDERPNLPVLRANLKSCGAAPAAFPGFPASRWWALIADPEGHWVAGVRELGEAPAASQAKAELLVLDSRTGKEIRRVPVGEINTSLKVSSDGHTIYGIDSAFKVFEIEVAADANNPPTGDWSEKPCLVEDEPAGGRALAGTPQKYTRAYVIPLERYSDASAFNSGAISSTKKKLLYCSDSIASPTIGYSERMGWGTTPDGNLWIDRLTRLEQIDIATGKVMKQIPTPRSDATCSLTLYDKGGFLVFGNDAVRFVPFEDSLETGRVAGRVLVRKPGWVAQSVHLMGKQFVVRWANARYDGEKEINDAGLLSLYDFPNAIPVRELHGQLDMATGPGGDTRAVGRAPQGAKQAWVYAPDEDTAPPFEGPPAPMVSSEGYAWETSYLQTIRVVRTDVTGKRSTLGWFGWTIGDDVPLQGGAFPLEHSVGAVLRDYRVSSGIGREPRWDVYDIATRRLLASVAPSDEAHGIDWMSWQGSRFVVEERDSNGYQLIGYVLEH
jgi:hypothetical protein